MSQSTDLHIFADIGKYHSFVDAGGGGQAVYRDPGSHGLTYNEFEDRYVRDVYLHDGVVINIEERTMLLSRQRHHFSKAFYRVTDDLPFP